MTGQARSAMVQIIIVIMNQRGGKSSVRPYVPNGGEGDQTPLRPTINNPINATV